METGLHQLPLRHPAQVSRLMPAADALDSEILLRLLEIGFLPGEPVRVIAAGFPGGNPLAVRVGNTTFALRSREAALVRVQWLPQAQAQAQGRS